MPTLTVSEVAATIDHAVLKPNQTLQDLKENAAMCIEYGVASMCVKPCDIQLAAELLKNSAVMTSCVLSFPHGADTSATKIFQTEQAIKDGVQEIDMVMNISRFLSADYAYVLSDIKGVVDLAHQAQVSVKVIQESCYLTLDQVAAACKITLDSGADFVKTSTGFGPSAATPEIIETMVKSVNGHIGVKASGGIRTWKQAIDYLNQGATRLGIGATASVLKGEKSDENY